MAQTTRCRALAAIILAEVLALALWFSGTAVAPALRIEAGVDDLTAAFFTSAVQAGFVAGTLGFALTGIVDRFDGRYLFAASALTGAGANAAILLVDPGSLAVIGFRFITGIAMAGVYPVGMKLAVGWAKGDVGLLVGALVGALTLGSASPHLLVYAGGLDWRWAIGAASASAALAAVVILFSAEGPATRRASRFRPGEISVYWTNRSIRLANFGYLGHMWELYAMWAWINVFFLASFALSMPDAEAARLAALATFGVIACGALGAVAAGAVADRIGRTLVTSASLIVSGACCLLVGQLFDAAPALLFALAAVWGVAVVADSAQFSASVTELSPPDLVGTMLTLQTCIGFLLTLITIHAMPNFVAWLGWRWAFAPLAIGPALGAWAMLRLRGLPEARRLAGGAR